ncbi:MAG: hypothetical protein ACD_50C00023G0001 [uncultured bacterium]|nr:MAG: hypothetical protein ACD_50C00023G0001 [uncultured bacterium]OGH14171.1 MAG: hypothetical protein A2687_03500 [Candidatus Levybacteria bacterium RIFCSPHIGHO2_01_FULL_38_26]
MVAVAEKKIYRMDHNAVEKNRAFWQDWEKLDLRKGYPVGEKGTLLYQNEGPKPSKPNVVDKGVGLWQIGNNITFPIWAGVTGAGIFFASPAVALVGLGGATYDGVQREVGYKYLRSKERKAEREAEAVQAQVIAESQPKQVTIFDRIKYAKKILLPDKKTIYYRKQPQLQGV